MEKKPTESPVTEGKIAPTLKDKDTRSAEPAGRPQQATLTETPRQIVAPSAYWSTSTASASPFNPADHQKLIRKLPPAEPPTSKPQTPTPDPVLSPVLSHLLNNSTGNLVMKNQKTKWLPPHPKKSNLTTQRHSMETETTSTSLSNHAMPTLSSTETYSIQTRGRSSSYSLTWPREQQKHGKKFSWMKRMEPMEATPTSSQNSRRPSLRLMLKEKHKHSYGNLDREKTQQTNISHNSGSSQDMPRSQMTNNSLNTSWKESTQGFYRRFLARTHSQPWSEKGTTQQWNSTLSTGDIRMKERTHGVPDTDKEDKHT